jgi:hypothetical protein
MRPGALAGGRRGFGYWVLGLRFWGERGRWPRRFSDRRHAREPLEQQAHEGGCGTGARQVQGDAGLHLDDAGGDLHDAQAQGVELGAPPGRALRQGGTQGSTSASRPRRAGTA